MCESVLFSNVRYPAKITVSAKEILKKKGELGEKKRLNLLSMEFVLCFFISCSEVDK